MLVGDRWDHRCPVSSRRVMTVGMVNDFGGCPLCLTHPSGAYQGREKMPMKVDRRRFRWWAMLTPEHAEEAEEELADTLESGGDREAVHEWAEHWKTVAEQDLRAELEGS